MRYGFHQKFDAWIQSFLSDHPQVVMLNGVHSDIDKVLSGVLQGNIKGLLFFILFINDPKEVVALSRVSFFADVTGAAQISHADTT